MEKIFAVIVERKPASIALNGPDGMLPQVQDAAMQIMRQFGIPAYIIADTTWGSCDLNTQGALTLSAEILFNIGHTGSMSEFESGVVMIDAFDDVKFDLVAEQCAAMLRGRTVSLLTDSQHLHQIENVRKILESGGVVVVVGSGRGQLNDGQIFGCEFYPAAQQADVADANVFLGQSNFHAAGAALSTGLPTYVLDPYFNEVREVTDFAEKMRKKAVLSVYKAVDARTIGIILGLRDGQLSKTTALKFKRELEKEDKTVQLLAMTDITNEKLRNLKGIDAFIQVACPRISTDNSFDKPVLSTPQGAALLKLLRGENIDGFLQIPHWL